MSARPVGSKLEEFSGPELLGLLTFGRHVCEIASSLTQSSVVVLAKEIMTKRISTAKELRDAMIRERGLSNSGVAYQIQRMYTNHVIIKERNNKVKIHPYAEIFIESIEKGMRTQLVQAAKSDALVEALGGISSLRKIMILYLLSIKSRYFGDLQESTNSLLRIGLERAFQDTNDFAYHLEKLTSQGFVRYDDETRFYVIENIGNLSVAIFETVTLSILQRNKKFLSLLKKKAVEVVKPVKVKAWVLDSRIGDKSFAESHEMLKLVESSPRGMMVVDETNRFIGFLPPQKGLAIRFQALAGGNEAWAEVANLLTTAKSLSKKDTLAACIAYVLANELPFVPLEENGKFSGVVDASKLIKQLPKENLLMA